MNSGVPWALTWVRNSLLRIPKLRTDRTVLFKSHSRSLSAWAFILIVSSYVHLAYKSVLFHANKIVHKFKFSLPHYLRTLQCHCWQAVSIVTRDDRGFGFRLLVKAEVFSSLRPYLALGSTQAPICWQPDALSLGLKGPGAWNWPLMPICLYDVV